MVRVRIRLLGPLAADDADGRAVDLAGTRLRVLLAALALEAGRPVSAARLTGLLWPEEQPANPVNALQALVSRLRAALGRELVAASAGGYRLALDPAEVDLHRFEQLLSESGPKADPEAGPAAERLAAALALWRGPAFADVPDPGFTEAAARLEALREHAREELLELRLARGEAAAVLPELQALSAGSPLRDRPRALLMQALHRSGRDAEALAVYEEGRTLLAEALGADPSPLLRQAHLAVLTGPPHGPERHPVPGAADRAARPVRDGLPAQLTSFLGREADLAAVRTALADSRLVTLTGPGGAGKTTLALESAARSESVQVSLVELASVTSPADVPTAVLTALKLREPAASQRPTALPHPAAEATERIVTALGNRPLLLVLDNCEHLVQAAATLAARLLAGCPGLRILATSREPLGITGEQLHPVPPLGLPPDPQHDASLTLDRALEFPAVRLFAVRGAAVRPGYRPDGPELPAVLRICRTLDGQPLAIELAAARLRTLSAEQIDRRLSRRFQLLTGGSRTALPRHRTLRAVVDWSWELLEKPERALLACMSVFAGGASLEAVEQVCATGELPTDDILDVLSSLVDKSLVVRTPGGRYRLLETIRVYAAERLEAAGATAAARDAHAGYFLALAEEGEPNLYTGAQTVWFARFLAEHDNLLAALRHAVDSGAAATALRMVAALGWYLWRRGGQGEHLEVVNRALALPGEDVPEVARAVAHGITALYTLDTTWDVPGALTLLRAGIAHRDRLDDPFAHPVLPMLDIMESMFHPWGQTVEDQALRLFDAPDPFVRAAARLFMGFALQNRGVADVAEGHLHDALDRFREIGDLWGQAFCSAGLADYAQWRGEIDQAVALWEQAISLEQQLGLSRESGDYRARMIHTVGLRQGYTPLTAQALRQAADDALREDSWVMVIAPHTALANAYRHLGTPELGRPLLGTAVRRALPTAGGAPQIKALFAGTSGYLEAAAGNLAAATEHHQAALRAATEVHDGPIIADCLQGWADLLLRRGEPLRAAELLGAAHLQRGMRDRSSPDVDRTAAGAEAALGPAAFAEAYERGRSTPREVTLASLGVTADTSPMPPS